MSGRMLFIGVSTAGSSIFELFPRWARILGIDAELEGYDIPLRAPAAAFRTAVTRVAEDEAVHGALVTTHKVDIYEHARALFDELDTNARLCREVSSISKREGALVGHAKDPITAGRALGEIVPRGYWANGAHCLCFGAGGAGTAIAVHLAQAERPPEQLIVTDIDRQRLRRLGGVLEELGSGPAVELRAVGRTEESDALLDRLPAGSLVVNATGLGKDAPGSPISDSARFPERAVVWELNYRGELAFLVRARSQERDRDLEIHDGWRYFLHGWAEVIGEIFGLELTPALFDRLAVAADRSDQPKAWANARARRPISW